MEIKPFQASRLKIERANTIISEFARVFASYAESEPCHIVLEQSADHPGMQAWWVRLKLPYPHEMSTILGDVFHNLRSALDHLAVDVVRVSGGNPNGVYFPFAESEDALEKQIKDKNFHRAPKEAIDLLKSLQPYKGGNERLRAIHDLDVADKHKALIPTVRGVSIPYHRSASTSLIGNTTDVRDHIFLMENRRPEIPLGTEMGIGDLSLRFPSSLKPFGKMQMLPTLDNLAQDVSGIIEAFAVLRSPDKPVNGRTPDQFGVT